MSENEEHSADTARAFVSLGANLGDRLSSLRRAIDSLQWLGEVVAVSSVYETDPVGYQDQPQYLNMAAELSTKLPPLRLLHGMLEIEQQLGRVRTFANAPRTVDLDLLLYGDQIVDTSSLTLPHPRMRERAFVLVPLVEIAADAVDPVTGWTMHDLKVALGEQSGIRVFAPPFAVAVAGQDDSARTI